MSFTLATSDECRSIIFKEPVPNKAMKNHVIRNAEVPNEGSCRVMCYMEANCVSINVGPLEGGKHKCELNNATDENQFTFFLENKPSYTYLAIQVTSYVLIKYCNIFLASEHNVNRLKSWKFFSHSTASLIFPLSRILAVAAHV